MKSIPNPDDGRDLDIEPGDVAAFLVGVLLGGIVMRIIGANLVLSGGPGFIMGFGLIALRRWHERRALSQSSR